MTRKDDLKEQQKHYHYKIEMTDEEYENEFGRTRIYRGLPEVEAPEKGDAVTGIIRALSYTWQDASLTEDEADWDDYVVTLILNLQLGWDEKRIRKCMNDYKPYAAYRKDVEHRKDDW